MGTPDEDTDEDPHETLHVYDGDGGVIVREGGNISTFGTKSPAVLAAFAAATDPDPRALALAASGQAAEALAGVLGFLRDGPHWNGRAFPPEPDPILLLADALKLAIELRIAVEGQAVLSETLSDDDEPQLGQLYATLGRHLEGWA